MAYIVHKIVDDGNEWLPDIVDTPIWDDFDEIGAPKSMRVVAALYRAVAERDNYYQENAPTAFGDPEYKLAYGIAHGIMLAEEIEEIEADGKRIFRKGKRIILVVDKLIRPKLYYEALRDNAETLRAFGF